MKYLTAFLSLLVFLLILGLLASPLFLVVAYPTAAPHFTEIAKTLIPWLSGLLLLLIFSDGVKSVFAAVAGALGRLRKLGAAGVTSEFGEQQSDVYPLSGDQLAKLAEYVQGESAWAWHFFIKYVVATIYGSQVQLLRSLEGQGPQNPAKLRQYYELFLERQPDSSGYKFDSYLQYLVSSLLIRLDEETSRYEITTQGKRFLEALDEYGVDWRAFRG